MSDALTSNIPVLTSNEKLALDAIVQSIAFNADEARSFWVDPCPFLKKLNLTDREITNLLAFGEYMVKGNSNVVGTWAPICPD